MVDATLAAGGEVQLSLCNMLGQTLRLRNFHAQAGAFRQELDLHGLPGGCYLLRLQTPDGAFTRPFVRK